MIINIKRIVARRIIAIIQKKIAHYNSRKVLHPQYQYIYQHKIVTLTDLIEEIAINYNIKELLA